MTNYSEFSDNLSILPNKDGVPWDNIFNSLGNNFSNSIFASTNSVAESFVTEHVGYNFQYEQINLFLLSNPTIAVLKFRVRYMIICDSSSFDRYSVSLQSYLAKDGIDLGFSSQTVNGIATNENNQEILTAEISFYLNNIPGYDDLIDPNLQLVVFFDGTNPELGQIDIQVYDISIEIVNATDGGYLLIKNKDGFFLENQGSSILEDVVFGYQNNSEFTIYNVGDKTLSIPQGGILAQESFVKFELDPSPLISLSQNEFIQIFFNYSSEALGLNRETITIDGDSADGQTSFYLYFNLTSPNQEFFSTISPSYENNQIGNNSSFSLSSFPVDITSIISLKIYNTGNAPLTISSVTSSGDGSVSSGSINSGSVIQPGAYGSLNINLSTNTEGNKSINIQVISNSSTNSNYNFTLIYAVLQQSKIEFNEGFSSGTADSILIDGQETDFGTVERDRSLSRYFILKNSGIYKNIIVNSITSSSTDVLLSGLPSFPYTLIPNNGNAITFFAKFETSKVGLKEGVLSIDYQEGSIYNSP